MDMSKWWERIELQPYTGNEGMCAALGDELGMNIYFDDVDASTCRFCFQADNDSPLVDYEITWEELEEWHEGERGLVLTAIEHDPSRFPELVWKWTFGEYEVHGYDVDGRPAFNSERMEEISKLQDALVTVYGNEEFALLVRDGMTWSEVYYDGVYRQYSPVIVDGEPVWLLGPDWGWRKA